MHPRLKEILDKSVEVFRADPRVDGGVHLGSVGKSNEDIFSDVDPLFIVRDESFDELDSELRDIFQRICPPIILWWPESINTEDYKNYAIFFEQDELLQYDINIMKASQLNQALGGAVLAQCGPEDILFDKTGALTAAVENKTAPHYLPDRLRWSIEQYWIYVYIHVKYLRRSHTFKLLYAQGMLFQAHLEILRALYPEVLWSWWADIAEQFLKPEHREALLLYFGATEPNAIASALRQEMDCFSRDARAACEAHGIDYPEAFEQSVRDHLAR